MKQIAIKTGVITTIASAVATFIVIALLLFGPSIETALAPVYANGASTVIESEPGSMVILLTITKVRACTVVGIRGHVYDPVGDKWVPAGVQLLNIDGTERSLEKQGASGEPIVRKLRIVPSAPRVRIAAEARCHPFWITVDPGVEAQNLLVKN